MSSNNEVLSSLNNYLDGHEEFKGAKNLLIRSSVMESPLPDKQLDDARQTVAKHSAIAIGDFLKSQGSEVSSTCIDHISETLYESLIAKDQNAVESAKNNYSDVIHSDECGLGQLDNQLTSSVSKPQSIQR